MEGGEISGNTVTVGRNIAASAGVYVGSYGIFIMNGGTITGNTVIDDPIPGSSNGNGGGVYAALSSSFTMNGGSITGNFRNSTAMDVYIGDTATLFVRNGGTIGQLDNRKR
jgi:hypothetical protein